MCLVAAVISSAKFWEADPKVLSGQVAVSLIVKVVLPYDDAGGSVVQTSGGMEVVRHPAHASASPVLSL